MTVRFPSRDDCRQMEALLPPFVDGEASAAVAALVEAHLAGCAPCRSAAAVQREVRQLLVNRRPSLIGPVPAGLAADVHRVASRSSSAERWPRWSAAAAAALVVVGVTGAAVVATGASSVVLAAQLTLDHLKCFVIDGADHGHALSATEGQAQFHDQYAMDVRLPAGSGDGRARLVSVRHCLYGEGWVAHALYRIDGEPVSVFVLGDPRQAASFELFGRQAQVISRHGATFVVVAPAGLAQVAPALGLGAE